MYHHTINPRLVPHYASVFEAFQGNGSATSPLAKARPDRALVEAFLIKAAMGGCGSIRVAKRGRFGRKAK